MHATLVMGSLLLSHGECSHQLPTNAHCCLQMLQHVWTYKPLVHDVLGMQANSISIETKAEPGQLPGSATKKRYEVTCQS